MNVMRAMTSDGSARCLIIDSTDIVNRAVEIHGAYPAVTAVLGRVLTAASLMGSLLGEKQDLLTLRLQSPGELGVVLASSDYMGNVRGFLENPAEVIAVKDGKPDIAASFLGGTMHVMRDIDGKEPYTGVSTIETGDIAADIAAYYAKSEQIPTLCVLGVKMNEKLQCVSAGGVLIQLLPYADESIIDILEKNIGDVLALPDALQKQGIGDTLAGYLKGIEYDVFDSYSADYKCVCSREKTDNALLSLGKSELLALASDKEETELTCRFCDNKYIYTKAQLTEMADSSKNK